MTSYVMGVDPGYASGAICILAEDYSEIIFQDVHDNFDDVSAFFLRPILIKFACIERVSAMRAQGVTSSFTFGDGFGALKMALRLCGIPWELVSPVTWQGIIDIQSSNKPLPMDPKERTKVKSQNRNARKLGIVEFCKRRFPAAEWTGNKSKDSNRADALCIAYYASRKYGGI